MWSSISIIGLLCLARSFALPTEEVPSHVLKYKKVYSHENDTNYEIVLDDQAIRDNTLVHAGCKVDKFREQINCLFVLQMFSDAKRVDERTCRIYFEADKARQISNQFRLKKLFGRYLAFVWADEEKLQSDAPKKHLVLSVINMHNCKIKDYKFESSIDDFHVIPYEQSFDVYYQDEKQCEKDFMCGETFDSTGKVLNGPATSYLPSEYFTGNTLMCSVQANSSAKGHYLIAPPNFHLIGADFGKKENMGPLPLDDQVTAYACDDEFLGYCWRTTNPENRRNIVNCQQFNSRGKLILSSGTSPEYQVGAWMAMRNLNASQLLILVNKCDNFDDSCVRSTKDVEFRVLRMNPDGGTKELHAFRGLECDRARDVKSEVTRNEDGRVCATLACLVRYENGDQSVNLLSTCVQS